MRFLIPLDERVLDTCTVFAIFTFFNTLQTEALQTEQRGIFQEVVSCIEVCVCVGGEATDLI